MVSPRDASVALAARLQSNLREENFLVLALRGEKRRAAALTMNTLIHRFVDEAAEQEALQAHHARRGPRQPGTRSGPPAQGRRAAPRVIPGRDRHHALEEAPVAPGLSFTQPTVYGSYFGQRNALDSIRRDRQEIEEVLRRSRQGEVAVDAFNTITSVRQAPDLQRCWVSSRPWSRALRDTLALFTRRLPRRHHSSRTAST